MATPSLKAPDSIGDDLLSGISEIAAFIGQTPKRTYYLCEQGHLPAFKWNKIWQARKSKIVSTIEERERRGAA
jgi:hypothetical protein